MREVVSKLDYIDGFLNKPVDLTKLEKLIKSVIGWERKGCVMKNSKKPTYLIK